MVKREHAFRCPQSSPCCQPKVTRELTVVVKCSKPHFSVATALACSVMCLAQSSYSALPKLARTILIGQRFVSHDSSGAFEELTKVLTSGLAVFFNSHEPIERADAGNAKRPRRYMGEDAKSSFAKSLMKARRPMMCAVNFATPTGRCGIWSPRTPQLPR